MCPKAYKYVLRGANRYQGQMNKATFMTSNILPNETELNCRVVSMVLAEDGTNNYSTDIIEVRANFNQPMSLDVKSQSTTSHAITQSTTLCFFPNDAIPCLLNPTNKFVISRPTNQLWEIELINGETGNLLVDSNGAQPQNYILELEFTKIDQD